MRAHHGLIQDFIEAILFAALNLKMFCSSCGENCPLEAKYYHECGDRLQQDVTEPEEEEEEEDFIHPRLSHQAYL